MTSRIDQRRLKVGKMDEPDTYQFEFTGGDLCLDFTNTADGDVNNEWHERLNDYADLVAWARQAGALTDAEAARLLAEAEQSEAQAATVLNGAIELRFTLYRIFSALAADDRPEAADLVRLNAALAAALTHLRVIPHDDHFDWGWAADGLARPLWPVVYSAAELLVSDQTGRIHECAGDTCSWLFLDTSRNHSRRWCDMKGCGNRAKARRHYQRAKQSG
jgi:predicted RNA-binding Zn ribbon-like protein